MTGDGRPDGTRSARARFGAAAEALLFLSATLGICAVLTTVFFSHRSPTSLTPLAAHAAPLTQKVLLIVVDALRADTAFDPARMPHVVEAAGRGASGVATSTSLSMTVPGVRAIGTGTASDYLDLFENWGAPVTDKPNLLANLQKAGISTGIIGDKVWATVYGPWLNMIQTETGLSGFDYYIHSTEKPDRIHAERARRAFENGTAPRFLVVHFVGLDHAGHAWGPQSDRYAATARSLDQKIDGLLRVVGPDITVILTSDHAITNRGGHGGSDAEARRTPLVMFGRGIRRVSGLAVDQVDLTPTVAALMGVPIPAQSTGEVIAEALDVSDADRSRLLELNRDQLLHLLQATYPARWERRLAEAKERVRLTPDANRFPPASRSAVETIEAVRQTIDKRDWEDRFPVIVWLGVGLLLCGWLWSCLGRSEASSHPWVTVGAAASILAATLAGLARPELRLPVGVLAAAAMLGVVLYHDRGLRRFGSLAGLLPAGIATATLSALIVYGRIRQYRSDTMFGDVRDGVAALLGWAFFVAAVALAIATRRWRVATPASPSRPRAWEMGALGVSVFVLMGFGGRPLGLASFGALALLTCLWHVQPGESAVARRWPHLGLAAAVLLLGLATLLAAYSKSYLFLGSLKWKNPGLGVRVAAAIVSCPLPAFLLWRDQRTTGGASVARRALSVLVGAAALGAALSQVWPTDRMINSVLLLCGLSLPVLVWLGRGRSVWRPLLVSLVAAWIVMSDPKEAMAISVMGAYLVVAVAEIPAPDGRASGPIAIGLWILGVRAALVVLLEGSFNFDSIEIATALMGNLAHSPVQGGLRVFLKYALPIFVLGVILAHRLPPRALMAAMRVALFLIVARILHLTTGILATSGQFYTPYRLAEELVFYLAFSLSFAICLFALLAFERPRLPRPLPDPEPGPFGLAVKS